MNRRSGSTQSPAVPAEPERLQKVLARAGIASRRELERWIVEGRIQVNGKVAELGLRVGPTDKIRVDGRDVSVRERETAPLRVLLYHKAAGEICATTDPEGRPTVFDALPRAGRGRWLNVGRLDYNTTGDGLVTALQVLRVVKETGVPLAELAAMLTPLPQTLQNVEIAARRPIEEMAGVAAAIQDAESVLGDRGRVLVRYSGTQPLARVMVEGEDAAQIDHLARDIVTAFEAAS